MSLQPGNFLIKNVTTGFYILPNNFTTSDSDQQVSTTLNVGIRDDPVINVSVNLDGLYNLKSPAGLYIAAIGTALKWQDSPYDWDIKVSDGGFWIIIPHDAPQVSVAHGAQLSLNETATASNWEFIPASD
ncbi:hypothetical protein GALMADRAFT_138395 [Galerina marginata CBS 339.88]|uniref:Ricin B lectin domain-containing protein n=1 Tax=Galerina marginata (strain CBS 339.88) TaxID=685588 RepID=A0A067T514_GALM3|nr:hypothetical protein GALMADRAFT_138395 [Galerina marginata CBS 339.88]